MGKVGRWNLKTTGKQILKPGWRVLFDKQKMDDDDDKQDKDEEKKLPLFTVGEHGPHVPDLPRMDNPPKPHTEATLLRAMERQEDGG